MQNTEDVRETVPDFLQWFNRDSRIITRETFYMMIKRGMIPHCRLGNRIFLNRGEVLASLKRDKTKHSENENSGISINA
jgi:hypothetical protein